MNIKNTIVCTYNKFNNKKIKSAQLEAEILLSFVINKPREFIIAHPEYKLNKQQLKKLQVLVKKRLAGFPIAYLIGSKEFFGFNFLVNKHTLIPRPETELLVEKILDIAAKEKIDSIIDVGTGSGCIIITLAKFLKQPALFATDISIKTLLAAKYNAKLNSATHIKFLQGNLLKPLINLKFNPRRSGQNSKMIIVANLPYLTAKQIASSPSIRHEPKIALAAGPDGLKYYRQLLQQIARNNFNFNYLLLEIDPTQKNSIGRLIREHLPDFDWQIKKDLKGHNRLVVIKR